MKTKHIPILAKLLAATAVGLGSASADTTTITYSYYTATSSADTSWVSPAGYTSVKAVNFGGGETTFGGVTWLDSVSNANGWGGQTYNAAPPIPMVFVEQNVGFATIYGDFYPGAPALLTQGAYKGDTGPQLELQNFTVGQEYLVQFVLADNRAGAVGLTVTIDGSSANIASQDSAPYQFAYGDGKFAVVTARFTPSVGDTQLNFRPLVGSGLQVNGVQVLTLADPFANWMSTNYPAIVSPDNQPGADPDNDGIKNLMEYVLQGGNPSVSTPSIVPTLNASGLNFVFTYYRRADATGTTQTFEYGTDLTGWTPVAISGGPGVVVTPNTPSAGIDKVEITVAKGANTKLFGRLQVVK